MTIFRKYLVSKIKHAMDLSDLFGDLSNPSIKGRLREIFITELIEPILPQGVSVTTGVVIDPKGVESNQLDVIIYSSSILPNLIKTKEQSVIPSGSVLSVIEVKSILNRDAIIDSIDKAKITKTLCVSKNEIDKDRKIPFSVFAFSSDLTGNNKTEWKRYLEITGESDPISKNSLISNICVARSGYSYRMGRTTSSSAKHGTTVLNEAAYSIITSTKDYDEILEMLIYISTLIPIILENKIKRQFFISDYLQLEEPS